jgi:hypothetical protein
MPIWTHNPISVNAFSLSPNSIEPIDNSALNLPEHGLHSCLAIPEPSAAVALKSTDKDVLLGVQAIAVVKIVAAEYILVDLVLGPFAVHHLFPIKAASILARRACAKTLP